MDEYMQVIQDGMAMCKAQTKCRKCPVDQVVGMDFCPFDSLDLEEWERIAEKIKAWTLEADRQRET